MKHRSLTGKIYLWVLNLIFASLNIPVDGKSVPNDVPCYDETWTYSSASGKCYKILSDSGQQPWKKAVDLCAPALKKKSNVNVTLIQFHTEHTLKAVVDLLQKVGNMESLWIGANRSDAGDKFYWQNPRELVNLDYLRWAGATGVGNCLKLSSKVNSGLGSDDWRTHVHIENVDCSVKLAFYCEHAVPFCTDPPGGFNSSTMVFSPPVAYPQSIVTAQCKPGMYMVDANSERSTSKNNLNTSVPKGQYYCHGKRDPNNDPLKFVTEFQYSGYDLTKCEAVRCNYTELEQMEPERASFIRARNYETGKTYGPQQKNQFNVYGNIITLRCSPGYLFPDRKAEKEIRCGLKENSSTEGEYEGYSGTILPLPKACEKTTCLFEDVLIEADYNMQEYFLINNNTEEWSNVSKHAGSPYALNAQLRFFCLPGYETVNKHGDLNVSCSDLGTWSPQLIGCIEKTEKLPVSDTGRFEGVKEEAKSAEKISSAMIVLSFIFLGLIVILDLTTIGRDTKHLIQNVKLQKKRYDVMRRKHKPPKQEEMPFVPQDGNADVDVGAVDDIVLNADDIGVDADDVENANGEVRNRLE